MCRFRFAASDQVVVLGVPAGVKMQSGVFAVSPEAAGELLVVLVGGQGHDLGRGNQQISPALLSKTGLNGLRIIATKGKLAGLQGRPLLVDTNETLSSIVNSAAITA